MLTQAMPSVVKALSGVLPPTALKQLTQALGNCNQEVSQRGDVNVSPDAWTNINNDNGVYYGDTWNGRDYGDIINNVNNDITNNNQNLFDFTTRQQFTTNNFYGGDTINNAGDTFFDTVNTNNLVTNYITVNNPPGEQGPVALPVTQARLAGTAWTAWTAWLHDSGVCRFVSLRVPTREWRLSPKRRFAPSWSAPRLMPKRAKSRPLRLTSKS